MSETERLERLKRRFEKPEAARIAAGEPVRHYEISCDRNCVTSVKQGSIPDLARATEGWHVGLDVGFPDECPTHAKPL